MASFASTLSSPPPASTILPRSTAGAKPASAALLTSPRAAAGLKLAPKISQFPATKARGFKSSRVSCSFAQPETLQVVQSTIAKQLSIDEGTVVPETKFVDLGADSLDTVEIMMALEEKFGVSIGEDGAQNITTVQDAADLIEKVKTAAA